MVKIGFICEGSAEKRIVESNAFQNFLAECTIYCVRPVIDVEGGGNLLPKNIERHIALLQDNGAEKICVLTDREQHPCIKEVKNRISLQPPHFVVVAVTMIESWFLADSETLSKILKTPIHFDLPEQEKTPFQTIKSAFIQCTDAGISKKRLPSRMLNNGYSILNSAAHPNCPSAKYFVDKLTQIGKQ